MHSSVRAWMAAAALVAAPALASGPNQVVGTWRPVSATVDGQGNPVDLYGPEPAGQLIFTPDLRYSVILHDRRIPRFASNARGEGTDAENLAALNGSIALYGSYSVDRNGVFTGNVVEGSTFPNWIGDRRTNEHLKMAVEGDRLVETFQRPAGPRIRIVWERVR